MDRPGLDSTALLSVIDRIEQQIASADRRRASYAEVYGLVVLENRYRDALAVALVAESKGADGG